MKRFLVVLTATMALTGTSLSAKSNQPNISMQTARAKALALVPGGRIQAGELETEHGKLVYSFDIKAPKRSGVEEIQISAANGTLVSRKHESAADEKSEAKSEAQEHR